MNLDQTCRVVYHQLDDQECQDLGIRTRQDFQDIGQDFVVVPHHATAASTQRLNKNLRVLLHLTKNMKIRK
jgi:hypothetical protein